jgi:hypothetical protein
MLIERGEHEILLSREILVASLLCKQASSTLPFILRCPVVFIQTPAPSRFFGNQPAQRRAASALAADFRSRDAA